MGDDALYFRMKQEYNEGRAKREVVQTLEKLCGPEYDLRFFLGNISTHPTNFTIVGLWRPRKAEPTPATLFDDIDFMSACVLVGYRTNNAQRPSLA